VDKNLTKSLTDLIDETLMELDELRKSRFAASEIKIEGPGAGIDGKPSNGDLHAKKAEDDKDEDKDDKDDKDMEKGTNDEAEKSDNDPADSEETKRKLKTLMSKKDEDKDDEDEDDKEPHEDDPKHEEKEKKIAKELLDMHKGEMKKSLESSESLMKSYVEERVAPLEEKLATILDLVNKIADQPIAPKGATARTTPLLKSADDVVEPLSKAQVANKLFELKKSGAKVDSNDIVKVEMGQDLKNIIKKYEIS
jgi:TATA-binding protein-associated factor Taf7